MAAAVWRIPVQHPEQMHLEVNRLVAEGFVVATQTNRSITLIRRKQLNVAAVILGLLFCVLPLVVYLIVFALEKDRVVEIVLVDGPPALPQQPAVPMSPDGAAWWDGTRWVAVTERIPPNAVIRPDGQAWWDGQTWRAVPGG